MSSKYISFPMSANIYVSARYLSAELSAPKAIKIYLGVLCKILIYLHTKTLSADRSLFYPPMYIVRHKYIIFASILVDMFPFKTASNQHVVPPLFHKEVLLSPQNTGLARTTAPVTLSLR